MEVKGFLVSLSLFLLPILVNSCTHNLPQMKPIRFKDAGLIFYTRAEYKGVTGTESSCGNITIGTNRTVFLLGAKDAVVPEARPYFIDKLEYSVENNTYLTSNTDHRYYVYLNGSWIFVLECKNRYAENAMVGSTKKDFTNVNETVRFLTYFISSNNLEDFYILKDFRYFQGPCVLTSDEWSLFFLWYLFAIGGVIYISYLFQRLCKTITNKIYPI